MDENGMDVYDTIMPVFILSKILGLAPFHLRGIRGKRKFHSDVGLIILLRFIGIIGTMLYLARLIEELNLPFDLRGMALRCELYMGTVLTATMLITAVTMRKVLISAVEDLVHIDDYMRHAGIRVPYKNARKFSACQIVFITCVFSLKAIMQPFIGSTVFLVIYNVFNVVDYINTITLFQYVDFVLLLRQRYIWLNRKIKSWSIVVESKYEECFFLKNDLVEKHIFVKPAHVNDLIDLDLEVGLNVLGEIHNNLYDISQKVNKVYSVRLLITVGMRMVMILTQLLTIYKYIFDKKNKPNPLTLVLVGIYLFLHTSKLFMIASLSSNMADRVCTIHVKKKIIIVKTFL